MIRRLFFGGVWLGLIGYAGWGAPPTQPNTVELIQHLSLGQLDGINPLIVALFYLMGVWPLIYASVLLFDGQGQRVPAWLFVLASFGVGAFALLPYLALRQPNPTPMAARSMVLRGLDSRWTAGAIALLVTGLLIYGFSQGDGSGFVQQWHTSRFIHVMSLDFTLLCLLFPALLRDDMARRQWNPPQLFWLFSLLPLLGPVLYLIFRPAQSLPQDSGPPSLSPTDAQSIVQ